MCGRYTLTAPRKVLEDRFALNDVPSGLRPRFNIAPGQEVALVANDERHTVKMFRWGLVPFWAKDPSIGHRMINARADTLARKPSFRNALKSRRCLVLADGFYEWKKEGKQKLPMYIRLQSGEPFAFAGLWETWQAPTGEELRTCTIVTTEPNELLAPIHNRMPVMLTVEEEWAAWLGGEESSPSAPEMLLRTLPGDQLEAYAVSRLVNSPANDRAECIMPVPSA